MANTLLVGIDAHLEQNAVRFLDQQGNKISKIFFVLNNQLGSKELQKYMDDAIHTYNFDSVKVATESTSFLDFHIAYFLADRENFPNYPVEVYRFNPKLIKEFKKYILKEPKQIRIVYMLSPIDYDLVTYRNQLIIMLIISHYDA